jgi:hypothetical protein
VAGAVAAGVVAGAAVAAGALAVAAVARGAVGQIEAQATADRVGFGETQLEALAGGEGVAALLADQCVGSLLVAEIFLAEGRDRDQPIAAEALDGGEEAEGWTPVIRQSTSWPTRSAR